MKCQHLHCLSYSLKLYCGMPQYTQYSSAGSICTYSGISLTGTSRGPHERFQLLRVPVIESNEIQ